MDLPYHLQSREERARTASIAIERAHRKERMASSNTKNEKGNLLIAGTPVMVTGTVHHGLRGVVVAKKPEWDLPKRVIAVKLDEFPATDYWKFYLHNLIPHPELQVQNPGQRFFPRTGRKDP